MKMMIRGLLLVIVLAMPLHTLAQDFDFETYTNEDGSLSFEHPVGWSVVFEMEFFAAVFATNIPDAENVNMSDIPDLAAGEYVLGAFFFDPGTASFIIGDVDIATATPQELAQSAYESLSADAESGTTFVEPRMVTLDNGDELGVIEVEQDETIAGRIAFIPSADGVAFLQAISAIEDAAALDVLLERFAASLTFDIPALMPMFETPDAPADDEVDTPASVEPVEDTGAELGANGFETSGNPERAEVVADAAWLSEATPPTFDTPTEPTFDFYITTNVDDDDISYVGIQNLPLDIESGTYEIGDFSDIDGRVTSISTGLYASSLVESGTVVIERDGDTISGSFQLVVDGSFGDDPDTQVRGVFSGVQVPPIEPCTIFGSGGVTLIVESPEEYLNVNVNASDGQWAVIGVQGFEPFGPDDTFMLFLSDQTDPDQFGETGVTLQIRHIYSLQPGEYPIGSDDVFDDDVLSGDLVIQQDFSYSSREPRGTFTVIESGDTFSATFELTVLGQDFFDEPEGEVIATISGSIDAMPVPSRECRLTSEG